MFDNETLSNIIIKGIDEILKRLRPYKPDTKSITINYKTCKSRIELVVHVPNDLRRKILKIEIPSYQGYSIVEMRDETFNRIETLWQRQEEKWVLPASKLPSSERFLIVLEGNVPRDFINRIVRVQPAINRDQAEDYDRYWLSCMLKDVALLERIWNMLEVEEVNVNVKVGIEKCISAALPKEVKKALEATREFLRAGRGKSREKLIRTWTKYRIALRKAPSVDELIDFLYNVTSGNFFRNYVVVDDPYTLGDVKRDEKWIGPFPERMIVEAITFLNLKEPAAKGYLTFKKKKYIEAIKEKLHI